MIKPKQTEYKGYLFRSRLEARWAVFFDALEIEWEYEPEGLVLSTGETYLPDFYLFDFKVYFEVKHKGLSETEADEAIRKISDGNNSSGEWAGLIAFGDPMDDHLRVFCAEVDDGGGEYEDLVTIGISPEDGLPSLFCYNDRRDRSFYNFLGEGMELMPMVTREYGKYEYEDFVTPDVQRARRKARQARFEYGERPAYRRRHK